MYMYLMYKFVSLPINLHTHYTTPHMRSPARSLVCLCPSSLSRVSLPASLPVAAYRCLPSASLSFQYHTILSCFSLATVNTCRLCLWLWPCDCVCTCTCTHTITWVCLPARACPYNLVCNLRVSLHKYLSKC